MNDFEDMEAKLISWVGVLALVGLIIFLGVRLFHEYQFITTYQANHSLLTKGVIDRIENKKAPRVGTNRVYTIRYHDQRDSSYVLQAGGGDHPFYLGDTVTIRYKPDDPEQALVEGSVVTHSYGTLIVLLSCSLFCLILFILIRNDQF